MKSTGTSILTIYWEKLKKMSILYPKPILCNVLKELCAIRDNIISCD